MNRMVFLLLPAIFSGCIGTAQLSMQSLPYPLDHPTFRVELDDELHEISGLQIAPNGRDVLAVQDERGTVYVLDRKTMQIKQRFDFLPEGDFEGVTALGDTIFAVKSSGTIYQIADAGTPQQTVEKFKYGLSKLHDIEGLSADAARRKLLLACKAAPPEQAQDEKHVYAFSLESLTMDAEPVLRIRLDAMVQFLEQHPALPHRDKMLEFLTRPEREGALPFSPSGIAVHPVNGHYYILSSAGKMLAVYAAGGELLALHRFDKGLFEQPEGICFDKDNMLYIASEGKKGKAMIAVFKSGNP